MKSHWTSIAWSFAYLLLLLSLVTPLTVITAFLLVVPGTLLYTMLPRKKFLVHIAGVWIALVAIGTLMGNYIFGSLLLLQAIYFMIPSIAMGHLYKKHASAVKIVITGMGVILLEFLLLLSVGSLFFDFNLASSIEDIMSTAVAPLQNVTDTTLTGGMVWSPEMTEKFSTYAVRFIPFTLILCSLLISSITHVIVRPTLNSMGHVVSKMPPLRDWRLPRSLIWYYLISTLLIMFAGPSASEGSLGMILDNLIPLLQVLFIIQTASFVFFVAYHKKWYPVIPVLLVLALPFVPGLWIAGLLDIAFPLREMITRSRR